MITVVMPLGETIPRASVSMYMIIAGAWEASDTDLLGSTIPTDGAVMASDGAVAITIHGDTATALGAGAVTVASDGAADMAASDGAVVTPDMVGAVMARGVHLMVTITALIMDIMVVIASADSEGMPITQREGAIIEIRTQ